jgi:hypothetical protein
MNGKSKQTGMVIVLGVVLGAVAGVLAGNIGIWVGIGVAIGIVIGGSLLRKKNDCPACAALHRMHEEARR